MVDFFTRNIITVYFFYGLSFFSMGLAIFLEAGHSSELDFSRALRPLCIFGIIHGSHEWLEMFLIIQGYSGKQPVPAWIDVLRLILLSTSFAFLIAFGLRMIWGPVKPRIVLVTTSILATIWLCGLVLVLYSHGPGRDRVVAADVYTRYALAIPGAALTAWGLILQRRKFHQAGLQSFGNDVIIAAIAFACYGGIGQLFTPPTDIFFSPYINSEAFLRWFGFPVQAFRALMACIVAVFIIRSLRAFEVENSRRINALHEAQQAESHRLEVLREELLYRTVKAQENERQRIARELHDETGQTLTALALGLRALSETIAGNPRRAEQQSLQLQALATNSLDDLRRMVTGLHPPQLDDLGLPSALRWYADETRQHYDLPVSVAIEGKSSNIPPETRVVLYRIAQEAITNVVRHAHASQANIRLQFFDDQIILKIEDNGIGFDVTATLNRGLDQPCWGLLGIQERTNLINGKCQISSQAGRGTCIEIIVPASQDKLQYASNHIVTGG